MKRPTMKVNGTRYTIMVEGSKVSNANYPPMPRHPGIPSCPPEVLARGRDEIKTWMGKACADADAERDRRWEAARKERAKKPRYDVDIVIAFPEFEWQGGDLGAEVKWEEVMRGEIGAGMDLILPGGRRKIPGRIVGVSDEKVIANAKRLEMEAARENREESKPPKPSPNPKGRKPEYDSKEDARVYALYQGQPERIPIEIFRKENQAIKEAYTLGELRQLIDRARKRQNKQLLKSKKKRQ